jgi:3-oxoacyl-[acyl-carrier-protein] synthase II
LKRVVVTGMSGISPLGTGWEETSLSLRARKNFIAAMPDWAKFKGLNTNLGAPITKLDLPADRYSRKATRGMGRVALLAVRATELAIEDAGLAGDPVIASGDTGVSYGSSSGNQDAIGDFAFMMSELSTRGITATTYVRMMNHTAPVNIGLFFQCKGRIITTSSACTSGSQGIGYAYEAIKYGHQKVMLAGGAEELHPTQAAIFDTLFATSTKNATPELTPRAYDKDRDGLVIGEGAGTLVLEELDHALARGARIYAELVGYGTNSDGLHVTHPNAATMQVAMEMALDQSGLKPSEIGYIDGHGTATDNGDIAETQATAAIFGDKVPFSSQKCYIGHTLGACGALEAWMGIQFMREGWAAPNINLDNVDERCGRLDFIQGDVRTISADAVMSNNFAFGGINTSLIFKRWKN